MKLQDAQNLWQFVKLGTFIELREIYWIGIKFSKLEKIYSIGGKLLNWEKFDQIYQIGRTSWIGKNFSQDLKLCKFRGKMLNTQNLGKKRKRGFPKKKFKNVQISLNLLIWGKNFTKFYVNTDFTKIDNDAKFYRKKYQKHKILKITLKNVHNSQINTEENWGFKKLRTFSC
jgi:hypothetical protein